MCFRVLFRTKIYINLKNYATFCRAICLAGILLLSSLLYVKKFLGKIAKTHYGSGADGGRDGRGI